MKPQQNLFQVKLHRFVQPIAVTLLLTSQSKQSPAR